MIRPITVPAAPSRLAWVATQNNCQRNFCWSLWLGEPSLQSHPDGFSSSSTFMYSPVLHCSWNILPPLFFSPC